MSKIFYTSDLHFGHFNAIRFDDRPWSTTAEMDEGLVEKWNKKVAPEDTVYILGDISWYRDVSKTVELIGRLNGKKILIKGNHDRIKKSEVVACFEKIVDYLEVKDGEYNLVLCHYPILFYKNQRYGWIHLYGHLHTGVDENLCQEMISLLKSKGLKTNMYNVGTMLWNFEPVTLEEILRKYSSE